MAVKIRSRKGQEWTVGTYFAVPLEDGYGFGRVIGRNVVAIYDLKSDGPAELRDLDNARVLFFCNVRTETITSGKWPVTGHAPLEQRLTEPVMFAYRQPKTGKVSIWVPNREAIVPDPLEADLVGLEWSRGYEWQMVRQRIENHFAGRWCQIKEESKYRPERDKELTRSVTISFFDQDDAASWVSDLVEGRKVEAIAEAFRTVIDCEGYLQVDDAAVAVAAAEVVAAAAGRPASALPHELARWVARHRRGIKALEAEALAERALHRVRGRSELIEQWSEAGLQEASLRALDDLASRLK